MALLHEESGISEYVTSIQGVTSSEQGKDVLISGYDIPKPCVHRFTTLSMFKKICSEGYDNETPYLAFHGVGKEKLDQIDRYREAHQRNTRVLYDEELDFLIVKLLPGALHETMSESLTWEILEKLKIVGHGVRQALVGVGSTRFGNLGGRKKEGSRAFKPRSRGSRDAWPSLVMEVGVSQSLSQLRMDAWFWLTQSGGLTRVVLVIKIDDHAKSLVIEQWEGDPRVPPMHALIPTYSPTQVNKIELSHNTCVGAPLVINLANMFDVLPLGMVEGAILLFTMQELNYFYDNYWETMA